MRTPNAIRVPTLLNKKNNWTTQDEHNNNNSTHRSIEEEDRETSNDWHITYQWIHHNPHLSIDLEFKSFTNKKNKNPEIHKNF